MEGLNGMQCIDKSEPACRLLVRISQLVLPLPEGLQLLTGNIFVEITVTDDHSFLDNTTKKMK